MIDGPGLYIPLHKLAVHSALQDAVVLVLRVVRSNTDSAVVVLLWPDGHTSHYEGHHTNWRRIL